MQTGYKALWKRFKNIKRAYWSLILLSLAFILSLGSEFICSNVPLTMSFNGERIYPVFSHYSDSFYYSEDYFLNNGRHTRPDYVKIVASDIFKADKRNSVLFPLIPYGPYESMDRDLLQKEQAVQMRLVPMPARASIDITKEGRIQKSRGIEAFIDRDDGDLVGTDIERIVSVSPELKKALETRFENKNAPAFTARLKQGDTAVEVSMRIYKQRNKAPTKIRLRLLLPQKESEELKTTFTQKGEASSPSFAKMWKRMEKEDLEKSNLLLEQVKNKSVTPFTMTIDGKRYRAYITQDTLAFPMAPSAKHLLGLDDTGRDVFARVLYGFRTSMSFAIVLVIFSMCLGIIVGALQGYFGGIYDMLSQRIIEMWESLPFLYIMIFMGAVYGQSFILLLLCYALFNWIGISYYLRAEFLRLRRLPFVEAAQSVGIPTWRIMFVHILPNALVPVVTFFPFSLVSAIGSLTALDYLGFGLPVPTPSWGELFKQAQNDPTAWWLIVYPFIALFSVILLGVFIGEGARSAFDPKRESRIQ